MYEARNNNIEWIMERGDEGVRKMKEERRGGESKVGRNGERLFWVALHKCLSVS